MGDVQAGLGHDHAAGLRVVRSEPLGCFVVLDADGRILFAGATKARCRRFIANHARSRAIWCGCAGRPA